MKYRTTTFLLPLLLSVLAPAADWPQWRGPNRDGISHETGLLQEWPKAGPKLLWQVKDIDLGYSTPSVVGKRIYLLSNRGRDDEFVKALSIADGKQIWSTRIGSVGNPGQSPNYPAARSTPTVDGDVLYALGSDGDLACLESATGNLRWQKSLRTEFAGRPGIWAYSESPLIDGDALIVTPGGPDATMVALNKKTGDLIWKCAIPGSDQAAYASIIIVEAAGTKQYVQMVAKGLIGVEAKTGKFLWRYNQTARNPAGDNITTPVAQGDLVYSAGMNIGGGLVRLKAATDAMTAEQVYFSPKLPRAIGGAVLVDNYLYGATPQVLLCVDFKTGQVKWSDRTIAPGSLCYADKRLYLHGENGDLALIEPSAESYREKGRFTPPDQPDRGPSQAWAYPVIANGRLYIRDMGTMWCYEIKAGD